MPPKRKSSRCKTGLALATRRIGPAGGSDQETLSRVFVESSREGTTKVRIVACVGDESSAKESAFRKNESIEDSSTSNGGMFQDISLADDAAHAHRNSINSKKHVRNEATELPWHATEHGNVQHCQLPNQGKDEEDDRHSCGTYVQSLSEEQSHDMMVEFEMYMSKKMKNEDVEESQESTDAIGTVKDEDHEDLNAILQRIAYTGQEHFHPGYDVLDALRRMLF